MIYDNNQGYAPAGDCSIPNMQCMKQCHCGAHFNIGGYQGSDCPACRAKKAKIALQAHIIKSSHRDFPPADKHLLPQKKPMIRK